MDAESGHPTDHLTSDDLLEQLAKEPYRFDFFRAVRLLENHYADRPRIGQSFSPSEDGIRFGQKPSMAFPPCTLDSFETGPDRAVPRLFVNFFGLCGPNGPMPLHFTEHARERLLHFKDPALARFLDVFHHRLICLFYRAWATSQKSLDLDRPELADRLADQLFGLYIGSLFGLGTRSLRNRDSVPDWAKLYYSGRLVCQTRNAEGLEAILQDFFGIPTQIQTFIGQWLTLPDDSLCRLGETPDTGSLGLNVIIGSRFWECQLKFRIWMGPMSLADYERMLPSGDSFQRLRTWILNYIGEELVWEVQLVLKADEVPETRLGQFGRIGWTTWLKTQPFTRDADDLVLLPPREG